MIHVQYNAVQSDFGCIYLSRGECWSPEFKTVAGIMLDIGAVLQIIAI